MILKIKNKEVGILFGMPAIQRITQKIQLTEFTDNISLGISQIRDILYAGYLNYCLAEDLRPELTARDFYDYIEENATNEVEFAQVNEAIKVFNHSKYIKPSENGEDKKKAKK